MMLNRLAFRVCTVALMALSIACGQDREAPSEPKAVPLTPQQAACLDGVAKRQVALKADFATLHVAALSAQRSTVDLTLRKRRADEEMCFEYATCFGPNERGDLGFGALFASCLREAERGD